VGVKAMHAIPRKALRFILAGLFLAPAFASADSTVVGGNPVLDREYADTNENFSIVDTRQPFIGSGFLTHWEIWAENDAPVQLLIYRQDEDILSIVGQSDPEVPVPGYNRFDVGRVKIMVEAGDYIGMYFPDEGSVSFSTLDGNPGNGNPGGATFVSGSGTGQTNDFFYRGDRVYSIRAMKKK
jgi:hypothetical protein